MNLNMSKSANLLESWDFPFHPGKENRDFLWVPKCPSSPMSTKETQRGALSDQPKQGTIVRKIPQICKTCASSLIPPKWVPCNDSCTMSRYLIEWFMTLEDPVYKE